MSDPIITSENVIAALMVTTDRTVHDLLLDRSAPLGILTGMYAAIGCRTVELVSLTPTLSAWFDEEGAIAAQPNFPVSMYLSNHHHLNHQIFYGPAVFTGGADDEGKTRGIGPKDAAEIRRIITV